MTEADEIEIANDAAIRKTVLEFFDKPKSDWVKMPNWKKPESRPNRNSIVSWEIYAKPGMPDEHETVSMLQKLSDEGLLYRIIKQDTIWYCRK